MEQPVHDRISFYRVARLSLFLPRQDGGQGRWAIVGTQVKRGVPTGHVLFDGVLSDVPAWPRDEQVVECFDSALAQVRLF